VLHVTSSGGSTLTLNLALRLTDFVAGTRAGDVLGCLRDLCARYTVHTRQVIGYPNFITYVLLKIWDVVPQIIWLVTQIESN